MKALNFGICLLILQTGYASPSQAEEPPRHQDSLPEYTQEEFASVIGHIILGMVDPTSTEKVFELLGDDVHPWQGGSPFPLEFSNEEPGYVANFQVKFGDEDCRCVVKFATLGIRDETSQPLIGQFDVIRFRDRKIEHLLLRTRDKSGDDIFKRHRR